MLRKAPPLESIEIFIAAAQGGSFRSVARELALSPSAVSRRIASLEAFLEIQLFQRGPHQALTADGRRYLAAVAPAMREIQLATALFKHPPGRPLRIAVSHSLAACWLMPRLVGAEAVAGVPIELVPTRDPDVLRSGAADLAIWGGREPLKDLSAEAMFDVLAVPVAAPRLIADKQLAADGWWTRQPLLSVDEPRGLWARWFGTPQVEARIRTVATLQLIYEAAASGSGIALAIPLVANDLLSRARLVPLSAERKSMAAQYALYSSPRRRSHAERRFRTWLRSNIQSSVEEFELLVGGQYAQNTNVG